MFYGGLAGAVITLIISIIVYMKLQISQVIEDITGGRFKRKKANGRSSYETAETKRTTSEIKLRKKDDPVATSVADTALLVSQELEPTSMLQNTDVEPTALLVEEKPVEETSLLIEETTLLDVDETTLLVEDDETSIFLEGDGETAILTEVEEESDFQIEVDVMIVHTNKVIEQRSVVK